MGHWKFKTCDHPEKSDIDGRIFLLQFPIADGGLLEVECGQFAYDALKEIIADIDAQLRELNA